MRDLSRFQRWYGRDEEPVERQAVRAGALYAQIDGVDLRYVRVGSVEVVRRLYIAVRDANWGTVPQEISNVQLQIGSERFTLRFDARNIDDTVGVDLSWRAEITGGPGATLTCVFDGVANSSFQYNRIGWCVLHPAENASRPFVMRTPTGVITDELPVEIGPQLIEQGLPAALFRSFDAIDVEVADGVRARFEFEGDLFEIEDQRNWTDASFKTYSTPLSLGFPHEAQIGRRFRQVVQLTLSGASAAPAARAGTGVEIGLGAAVGRLPTIGLGAASHGRPLTRREIALLSALRLDHLRVDLDLASADWTETLARGVENARAIGAALELAIVLGDDDRALDQLAAALRPGRPPLARVLAFHPGEPTSSTDTVELVRAGLGDATGGAPIFGGTNDLFADLNRSRPELTSLDGVAWPLNATMHAEDDTSVAETASMHGETVRSARAFCGRLPLAVTPVTLRRSVAPPATTPESEPALGKLPGHADLRQPSLLGAAWTVASARSLGEAGAASITYFETTGWCGVVGSSGPAVPERIRPRPELIFPAYHVLADLGEWKAGCVLHTESSNSLVVEALAVQTGRTLHLLVANLTSSPQLCRISDLLNGDGKLRVLDEHSFLAASFEPELFRETSESISTGSGQFEFELAPFGTVRIDSARGRTIGRGRRGRRAHGDGDS